VKYSIYVINIALLIAIYLFEHYSDNDKTIIITVAIYLILLISNLLLGVFAQMDKKSTYINFYYSTLLILIYGIVATIV
jgi:hypothetical protein